MSLSIHSEIIICAYGVIPFDRLRVTGHGELVEPCASYTFVITAIHNYLLRSV